MYFLASVISKKMSLKFSSVNTPISPVLIFLPSSCLQKQLKWLFDFVSNYLVKNIKTGDIDVFTEENFNDIFLEITEAKNYMVKGYQELLEIWLKIKS